MKDLMRLREETFLAAQGGDPAALNELLAQCRPDIRRYARFQCQRSSAVEDVVQEALIILYRRVGTVRSPATLSAWLARVVGRLCLLPALMFMKGVEELDSLADSTRFATVPVHELRMDLVRALESLPAPHRDIILLRDMQQLTIAEIAQHLNLTREATKSRLHRARALVREYLLSKDPT
ncbi:sigma-70 family RNA polymerase sigma factor [Aquabacterium sp. A7-Y]|uniref:RNA polymerase sigma factor n=1 Tax=Aquabacterium sp. A7-Y TaxID=1349605 RepID=UPI00223D4E9F|nr:sigma-70 family RNA polymerase sigma factor [Aquabacterium sp. A7-Y]MCW7539391.1 sigma-70 family RNA polymerase sigma factor [Aquabacterium sp. A7-Y]